MGKLTFHAAGQFFFLSLNFTRTYLNEKKIRSKNQERTSIAQGIVYKVTLFELHELACICLKEILHISHISRYRS